MVRKIDVEPAEATALARIAEKLSPTAIVKSIVDGVKAQVQAVKEGWNEFNGNIRTPEALGRSIRKEAMDMQKNVAYLKDHAGKKGKDMNMEAPEHSNPMTAELDNETARQINGDAYFQSALFRVMKRMQLYCESENPQYLRVTELSRRFVSRFEQTPVENMPDLIFDFASQFEHLGSGLPPAAFRH